MAGIFRTGFEYLRQLPPSLRAMTKYKSKIRLKPLRIAARLRQMLLKVFVQSYDKCLRFKTKNKIRSFVNVDPGKSLEKLVFIICSQNIVRRKACFPYIGMKTYKVYCLCYKKGYNMTNSLIRANIFALTKIFHMHLWASFQSCYNYLPVYVD